MKTKRIAASVSTNAAHRLLFFQVIAWAVLTIVSAGCDDAVSVHNTKTSATYSETVAEPSLKARADSETRDSLNLLPRLEDDPSQDGWDTEAFSQAASQQLKWMGEFLTHKRVPDMNAMKDLAAPDFESDALRPERRRQVFSDRMFTVYHGIEEPDSLSEKFHGRDGLRRVVRQHAEPLDGAVDAFVKFKVVRVTKDSESITTTVLVQTGGVLAVGSVQQNAQWLCSWSLLPQQPPRLKSIRMQRYEEVLLHSSDRTLFADCTEAVCKDSSFYREQLRYGTTHWLHRVERRVRADFTGYYGLAIGDVNGDQLDDVYVCQPGGLPNLLLVQNNDGTVTDLSDKSGADFLDTTRSALLVDFDNDGDQDLAVATWTALLLLSNNGDGRFSLQREFPAGQQAYSLAAADYNNDGHVDLYACLYHSNDADLQGDPFLVGHPLPFHDANNGPPNILFQNDGKWQFNDVTKQCGLDEHNYRWSYAAAWEDYDIDGDADLYVANDFGRNCLYRNDDGRFVDVAAKAGVEDIASGMSVTWGDYNRDGHMDIYVSNMFSAAGGRVTFQRKFKTEANEETKTQIQRLARGNTLFENMGNGHFRDVTMQAGVNMGRWAWSSNFVDLNNDGWEDLVVANGHVTGEDSRDL